MSRRAFDELVKLMTTLRGPDGCPWDRKQALPDLKPYVIEEAYEVVDAIDRDDRKALAEEVGDLLLEAVFIAEITREEGSFDIYDAVGLVHDKLVRRHPHVFAGTSADDLEGTWEALKKAEKGRTSVTDGVPLSQPALSLAAKLQKRATRLGEFEVFWGDARLVTRELEAYLAVTAADIRKSVNERLSTQRRSVVEVLPEAAARASTKP